ncbi:hypothetical protein SNEBB_009416 [Seison nebaliae]|nr:hypothetical protein SNEBB_009416 [Seison nebaliae]
MTQLINSTRPRSSKATNSCEGPNYYMYVTNPSLETFKYIGVLDFVNLGDRGEDLPQWNRYIADIHTTPETIHPERYTFHPTLMERRTGFITVKGNLLITHLTHDGDIPVIPDKEDLSKKDHYHIDNTANTMKYFDSTSADNEHMVTHSMFDSNSALPNKNEGFTRIIIPRCQRRGDDESQERQQMAPQQEFPEQQQHQPMEQQPQQQDISGLKSIWFIWW